VRTPSRGERGIGLGITVYPLPPLNLPVLLELQGDSAFVSEELTAYELGYRALLAERLSLDIAAFYNDYDDLRAAKFRPDLAAVVDGNLRVPLLFANASQGRTHGFELAANWQAADGWRLQLAYSYLRASVENKPGASETFAFLEATSQPRHQISLVSNVDIRDDLDFDLWLRYTDEFPERDFDSFGSAPAIADHFSLNARLGWRPRKDLDLSLVGTNLLGPSHTEFLQETYPFPERVERAVYGQMKWSF